ncbi:MAG: DUF192 domain-containing protein [Patescibacteria group bacterium]
MKIALIFLGIIVLASVSEVGPFSRDSRTQDQNALVSSSKISDSNISSISLATSTIQAPNGTISAMIADTDVLRQHGLSDRPSMPPDVGMLFIFPEIGTQSFWMKDMHFSLDIVWIDEHKQVVGIAENVSPDSYPEAFTSPVPIKYVLELNAGKAADFGLKKGSQLGF